MKYRPDLNFWNLREPEVGIQTAEPEGWNGTPLRSMIKFIVILKLISLTRCPLSLSMIQLLFWMTMILLDRPLSIRPPASRHLLRTTLSTFLSCVGIPNPSNFKDLISWSMNPVSREDSSLHLLWMTRTSFLSKPHQCNCRSE